MDTSHKVTFPLLTPLVESDCLPADSFSHIHGCEPGCSKILVTYSCPVAFRLDKPCPLFRRTVPQPKWPLRLRCRISEARLLRFTIRISGAFVPRMARFALCVGETLPRQLVISDVRPSSWFRIPQSTQTYGLKMLESPAQKYCLLIEAPDVMDPPHSVHRVFSIRLECAWVAEVNGGEDLHICDLISSEPSLVSAFDFRLGWDVESDYVEQFLRCSLCQDALKKPCKSDCWTVHKFRHLLLPAGGCEAIPETLDIGSDPQV